MSTEHLSKQYGLTEFSTQEHWGTKSGTANFLSLYLKRKKIIFGQESPPKYRPLKGPVPVRQGTLKKKVREGGSPIGRIV